MKISVEDQTRQFGIEILAEKNTLKEAGKLSTFRVSDKVKENVVKLLNAGRSLGTIQRLYSVALSLPIIDHVIEY